MRGRFARGGGLAAALAIAGLAALLPGTAPAQGSADYEAGGSVRQVYVAGLAAKQAVTLRDSAGKVVKRRAANERGAALFRAIAPGAGYTVTPDGEAASAPLRVLGDASAPPDTSVYDQSIKPDGYQYLTTRDGTQLAIDVHPPTDLAGALPKGVALPDLPAAAPTPTLIEYSGYGYANPAGPDNGIAVIANLMGFTVVDVNMRGTGCSGGAYDFFEPLQSLDGYDVVETIARQPWVKGGKVGMMGISYGGISQLFTAARRPPSLAAIAPLSTIDNTQTTLYPGGVLNTGFAVAWAKERINEARPATAETGQPWAHKRIEEGDATCAANQALHPEAVDLLKKIRANSTYRPKVADPLSPVTFVDKIDVPTFLVCQWTDEQTGGHCPTLAARLTGTDRKWSTFTNGTHIDSLAPQTFNRWYDFLKLYVAQEAPSQGSAAVRAAAPVVYASAMGVDGVTLPDDPIQREPTYEGALKAFEALKPVRVLFENGGGGEPGQPYARSEQSFDSWPVPSTKGRSFFLGAGGRLQARPAKRARADRFTWDPKARPLNDFSGSTSGGENGLWTASPGYQWSQPAARRALSYVTPALKADTTVIGAGFARLWLRSSARDVDLQATVSEVRPDGQELFVQSGWLRASMRRLDPVKSRPLAPVLSLRKATRRPLRPGRFNRLTIPLYYQGHPYRAGSRIRVTISAVNGDQPIWAFGEARPKGTAIVDVARGGRRRSQLRLPVVGGVALADGLPPCPLRGEPCRRAEPFTNRAAPRATR